MEDRKFAIIMVGTKGDLRNDKNSNYGELINIDKILSKAKKWNIPYIETSSLIGRNINFLFRQSIYEYWIQTTHYDFTT